MRGVSHFGDRALLPIAEATDYSGSGTERKPMREEIQSEPDRGQQAAVEDAATWEIMLLTEVVFKDRAQIRNAYANMRITRTVTVPSPCA